MHNPASESRTTEELSELLTAKLEITQSNGSQDFEVHTCDEGKDRMRKSNTTKSNEDA